MRKTVGWFLIAVPMFRRFSRKSGSRIPEGIPKGPSGFLRNIIYIMVIGSFWLLASTPSLAVAGKFSVGILAVPTMERTPHWGGLIKFGIFKHVDLELRVESAKDSGQDANFISGLAIYNFDLGIEQIKPYIGGGTRIRRYVENLPPPAMSGSQVGGTAVAGASFYLTDQLSAFADASYTRIAARDYSIASFGVYYTF